MRRDRIIHATIGCEWPWQMCAEITWSLLIIWEDTIRMKWWKYFLWNYLKWNYLKKKGFGIEYLICCVIAELVQSGARTAELGWYVWYEVVEIFSLKLSKMLECRGLEESTWYMLCDRRASAKWSPHCWTRLIRMVWSGGNIFSEII